MTAFIERRICGTDGVTPPQRFARLMGDSPRDGVALSLRAGNPELECELIRAKACERVIVVDGSTERLEYAQARVPADLRDRVEFEQADPLAFTPTEPLGLAISHSALHRFSDPDRVIAHIAELLGPRGMVYVDEFVGPDRFQWSDDQLEVVNRLLDCLPEELRVDLTSDSGDVKRQIARPDPERFAADHPAEAVAGSRIPAALDAHLEPVEVRPYGGAVYHQLFSRIMGNFSGHPELVRSILEFDAILTDRGVVASDYLWAAYRRPA